MPLAPTDNHGPATSRTVLCLHGSTVYGVSAPLCDQALPFHAALDL